MTETPKRSPAAHLPKWQKGQSDNPLGRPKGTRHRFSEAFLTDFIESWQKHGKSVLNRTVRDDPAVYLRVAATVLPKEVETTVRTELEGMSDAELKAFIQKELASAQQQQEQQLVRDVSAIDSVQAIDKAKDTLN